MKAPKSFFPVALGIIIVCACTTQEEKSERLAKTYCGSCHSFPDPRLLDKSTWETGVLPEMAFRMGRDLSKLPAAANQRELAEIIGSLPASALVTDDEWRTISEYYISNAPDALVLPAGSASMLTKFEVSRHRLPIAGGTLLTMIQFDSVARRSYVGTRLSKVYVLDEALTPRDSVELDSPPSDMIFGRQGHVLLTMGVMDPNDQRKGKIIQLENEKIAGELADSLKRPVDFQQSDMNRDGRDDLVVSAFGNFTGALIVLEASPEGYQRHPVYNQPGTRKTIIKDFNQDGLPDILALITQGDEQIVLFTNRGNFQFSIQVLKRFPPVYGSSYLDVYDFNKDGHFDLLYTNGDNADYSMVLKPYHGVRIFQNDGRNQFTETFFHPMHGASQARAADFDNDGDLDIAAISFFPDFKKHPEHGFVYLENEDGKFSPFITPLASAGRWITMELADIDGDTDVDILLGALNFGNGVPKPLWMRWAEERTSLLLLSNNLKSKGL